MSALIINDELMVIIFLVFQPPRMTECLDSHQTLTENIINMSLKAKFTHKINTNAVDFQAAANDLSMKIGVKIDGLSYLIVWIEQVDDLFIV